MRKNLHLQIFVFVIIILFCLPAVLYGGILRKNLSIELPGVYAGAVACGDLNKDGLPDLVIIGETKINGNLIRIAKVYQNTGSGFIEDENPIVGLYFGSVALGDYDNNGYLDLAVSGIDSEDNNVLEVYRNVSSKGGKIKFVFDNQQSEILSLKYQLRYSSLDWGDYNKDGLLDLAVCGMNYFGEASTMVFKNRGGLTYILEEDVSQVLLNVNKGQIRWVDYDNDGDLDLSVCGFNTLGRRAAKIFKNDPVGILRDDKDNSKVIFKLSSCYLEWGDADNDGDPDLLQSGWNEVWWAHVSLLENKLGGNLGDDILNELTYYNPELLMVGPVAWGDYDNDGDFDIAMMGTNEFSQVRAFVLKNNKGKFEIDNQQTEFTGLKNGFLKWFDYNDDGKLDLIAGGEDEYGNRKTIIYENDETKVASKPSPPNELKPVFVTNNDVTFSWGEGDDVDYTDSRILTYNLRVGQTPGGSDIYSSEIPVGNGNVGNKLSFKLNIPLTRTTYYWSVRTVDAQYQVSEEYYPEKSFLVRRFVNSNQSITDLQQSALAWGDYNNDESPDLVVSGEDINGKSRTVLFDNKNGVLKENTEIILPYFKNGSFAWGDYDNDDDLDLALSGNSEVGIISLILRNNPTGTLMLDELNSYTIENVDQSSMDWGDYDNDGDVDLVLIGVDGSGNYITKIYKNSNGTLKEDTNQNLSGYANGKVKWIDYDNDGDLDLTIIGDNLDYDSGRIYKNDGSGNLTEDIASKLPAVFSSDMAWCDFDSDGDLDVVVTGWSLITDKIEIKVLINDPVGKLTEEPALSSKLKGVRGGSICWGDYDNDGDADLVISGNDENNQPFLAAYENRYNTFNLDYYQIFSGVQFSSISLIDIENDGDLDLVTIGAGGVSLTSFSTVYDNNESVVNPNEAPQSPSRLKYELNEDQVVLSWNRGTDFEDNGTDSLALTYVYKMGTAPGGSEIASGRFEPGFGKLGFARSVKIINLESGLYYWSVKSIDNGLKESEWIGGQSFMVDLIKTDVVAKYPEQGDIGVSVSTTLRAMFNEGIDKEQFVSEKCFRLYYNGTMVDGTVDYNIDTKEGIFIPKDKLNGDSQYEVRITGKVKDIFGNLMGADITWKFKTAETVLATTGGLIKNKLGNVQIYISPNALGADEEIPISSYTPITVEPPEGVKFTEVAFSIGPENEVILKKPAILTIGYDKNIFPSGFIDIDESKLKIFTVRECNPGDFDYDNPIGGTVDINKSEISAPVKKLGVFGIFEDVREELKVKAISNVNFSPRVFSPAGTGQMNLPSKTGISFTIGEPMNVSITVYSPSGRFVKGLINNQYYGNGDQVEFWDGRDGNGNMCPSGIYIVKIEGEGLSVLKTVGILNK